MASPWDELLMWIEERQLVPLIGQDLLVVDVGGEQVPFYRHLATTLANQIQAGLSSEQFKEWKQKIVTFARGRLTAQLAELGVSLDEMDDRAAEELEAKVIAAIYQSLSFDDLVALHEPYQKSDQAFRTALKLTYDRLLPQLAIPEPLRKLAAIRDLKLFVSTSFDNLLERAVSAERGPTRTLPIVYSHTDSDHDVNDEMLRSSKTIVFQLLGRISSGRTYAAVESDYVEFMHSLHAKPPKHLFDRLKEANLLLLGNSFPGWLWRFFLRTAKNQLFWVMRGRTEFLIDRHIRRDQKLVEFITANSAETRLYEDLPPVEFVNELHSRWAARQAVTAGNEPPDSGESDLMAMEPDSIFISYSRDDRKAVETLFDGLEVEKIDAWFDRRQLRPGDAWDAKITNNILRCGLFMPVISESTVQRNSGKEYFRKEWDIAITQRLPHMRGLDFPFIIPIVIDETKVESAPNLPEEFRTVQAELVPDGKATPTFHRYLKLVLRQARQRQRPK